DEFNGEVAVSGAYGPGTIPSSVHINWTKALNEDTTLKSAEELQALYGDIIKGKKVIAYCQSGVRSAHTTLILTEVLGAEGVYNYDGSWIEYSHAHYEQKNPEVNVINGKS
ncbi:rhodanese-like domain-containing protein, partial [Vibrio sp. YT-15]|uniref:sulfurtransferase n=1 Tax=Vibrio sp. YT-15 TaxID=3074706 RepID=UPI0029649780